MIRILAWLVFLIPLAAATPATAAETPFLKSGRPLDERDFDASATLKAQHSFPGTIKISEADIDASQIKDHSILALEMDGATLLATFVRSEQLNQPSKVSVPRDEAREKDVSDMTVWYGNLEPHINIEPFNAARQDPLNSITLVKSKTGVTGVIRHGARLFWLRPMKDGKHLIVELDESKMPDEGNAPMPSGSGAVLEKSSPTESAGNVVIDVFTVIMQRAVDAYDGDMLALMQLAVAQANQSYINSDIGISLRLSAYQVTNYSSSNFLDLDMNRLMDPKDGYMDDSMVIREESFSDVVMLIDDYGRVIEGDYLCGLAKQVGSTAATAVAAVNYRCIFNQTFAHELGHLQSARHNPENDSGQGPYSYAHGYRYTVDAARWRTLMAYPCVPWSSGCPVLNAWSNPDLRYNGVPMGDAQSADNRRVLELTKQSISKYYSQ